MLEKYAPLLNWQESQVSGVRTFDALGWLKVLPTITLKYVFINGRIIRVHKCVAALRFESDQTFCLKLLKGLFL